MSSCPSAFAASGRSFFRIDIILSIVTIAIPLIFGCLHFHYITSSLYSWRGLDNIFGGGWMSWEKIIVFWRLEKCANEKGY